MYVSQFRAALKFSHLCFHLQYIFLSLLWKQYSLRLGARFLFGRDQNRLQILPWRFRHLRVQIRFQFLSTVRIAGKYKLVFYVRNIRKLKQCQGRKIAASCFRFLKREFDKRKLKFFMLKCGFYFRNIFERFSRTSSKLWSVPKKTIVLGTDNFFLPRNTKIVNNILAQLQYPDTLLTHFFPCKYWVTRSALSTVGPGLNFLLV